MRYTTIAEAIVRIRRKSSKFSFIFILLSEQKTDNEGLLLSVPFFVHLGVEPSNASFIGLLLKSGYF